MIVFIIFALTLPSCSSYWFDWEGFALADCHGAFIRLNASNIGKTIYSDTLGYLDNDEQYCWLITAESGPDYVIELIINSTTLEMNSDDVEYDNGKTQNCYDHLRFYNFLNSTTLNGPEYTYYSLSNQDHIFQWCKDDPDNVYRIFSSGDKALVALKTDSTIIDAYSYFALNYREIYDPSHSMADENPDPNDSYGGVNKSVIEGVTSFFGICILFSIYYLLQKCCCDRDRSCGGCCDCDCDCACCCCSDSTSAIQVSRSISLPSLHSLDEPPTYDEFQAESDAHDISQTPRRHSLPPIEEENEGIDNPSFRRASLDNRTATTSFTFAHRSLTPDANGLTSTSVERSLTPDPPRAQRPSLQRNNSISTIFAISGQPLESVYPPPRLMSPPNYHVVEVQSSEDDGEDQQQLEDQPPPYEIVIINPDQFPVTE